MSSTIKDTRRGGSKPFYDAKRQLLRRARRIFIKLETWFRRSGSHPLWVAGILIAAFICPTPQVGAQQDTTHRPLAIVGSTEITSAEVERALASRPGMLRDLPPSAQRKRMLNTLIAEHVLDDLYLQGQDKLSNVPQDVLASARRQALMKLYLAARFTPPVVTDADIAAYVDQNPKLFADRMSYRFIQLELSGGTPELRQVVASQIIEFGQERNGLLSRLRERLHDIRRVGVNPSLVTVWRTSEAIPSAVLDRLDDMHDQGKYYDQVIEAGGVSILFLLEAVPMSASPEDLRERIEQRLVQAAFDRYRSDLIDRIANNFQNGSLAPELLPRGNSGNRPSMTTSGLVFGVGSLLVWLIGLSGVYASVGWINLVRLQQPFHEAESVAVPALRRSGVAFVIGGGLVLLLLSVLGITALGAKNVLGVFATSMFLFSAIVIASAASWTWHKQAKAVRKGRENVAIKTGMEATSAFRKAVLAERANLRLYLAISTCVVTITIVFLVHGMGIKTLS